MQRLIKCAFILLCCTQNSGYAQETMQRLEAWMSHYYEKPEPEKFTKWLEDVSTAGGFEKPGARSPLLIFTSEILRMNQGKGSQWCKDLSKISYANKRYIGWSFYNANIPASEQCIKGQLRLSANDIKTITASTRYDPLSREPSSAADLDLLWATFFATGNEVAVNKIISVLAKPLLEKGTPGSVEILLLKGAAKWSLSSNIRQHKRVAEISQVRRSAESGLLRKELDEVIANATKPSS